MISKFENWVNDTYQPYLEENEIIKQPNSGFTSSFDDACKHVLGDDDNIALYDNEDGELFAIFADTDYIRYAEYFYYKVNPHEVFSILRVNKYHLNAKYKLTTKSKITEAIENTIREV